MSFELKVKLAVYRHFAESGGPPSYDQLAQELAAPTTKVLEVYQQLRAQRVLVLENGGVSIRMAPPFSGVATQHIVKVGNRSYFANCAWDALGIPAALQQPATVHSRCEQSMEHLRLEVSLEGPESSDWVFHCVVPAAHWWDDIVFT